MKKMVWPESRGLVRLSDGHWIRPEAILEYLQTLEDEIKCKSVERAAEVLPADIYLMAIQRAAGRLLMVKKRGQGEKRFPAGPTYEIVSFV